MQVQGKKQKQATGKPAPMGYTARLAVELKRLSAQEQDQAVLEAARLLREQKMWDERQKSGAASHT